jgi:hypothetical protein
MGIYFSKIITSIIANNIVEWFINSCIHIFLKNNSVDIFNDIKFIYNNIENKCYNNKIKKYKKDILLEIKNILKDIINNNKFINYNNKNIIYISLTISRFLICKYFDIKYKTIKYKSVINDSSILILKKDPTYQFINYLYFYENVNKYYNNNIASILQNIYLEYDLYGATKNIYICELLNNFMDIIYNSLIKNKQELKIIINECIKTIKIHNNLIIYEKN